MTRTPSWGTENGVRPRTLRAALVIDTDTEQHILLRRTLRRTGLFSLILSAESAQTAKEILGDPVTPELLLILVSADLAPKVIPSLTPEQSRRTAIVTSDDLSGTDRPVLRVPAEPSDIEDLLDKLG